MSNRLDNAVVADALTRQQNRFVFGSGRRCLSRLEEASRVLMRREELFHVFSQRGIRCAFGAEVRSPLVRIALVSGVK
jgi:hypothetical protein